MKVLTPLIVRLGLSTIALALVVGGAGSPSADAAADIYTTPGQHHSAGRQWRTWCDPYSQTARCTTQLQVGGKWVFNNLTYLPSPRSLWGGNPLATPGEHVIAGRRWRTECDTPATGRNGCRSYLWAGGQFVFNNIVQLGPLRTDLATLYAYRPPPDVAPTTTAPTTYNWLHGPNSTAAVTLTFDDCPISAASFRSTVDAATDLGIALVLFPTGNCITAGKFDPAYARDKGHYVFNHSITHPKLTAMSYSQMVRELGAPGVVTSYGRPPFGAYNPTVKKAYAAVGMQMWFWDLDTFDYRGHSSTSLTRFVVDHAKQGQSVLMHMQWHGFNGPTLKAMRDGLLTKGIQVCRNRGPVAVAPAGLSC